MIAFGYDCEELHETWTIPFLDRILIDGEAKHTFTALEETITFTGPTYDICQVAKSDLDFEFYDLSFVQSGPLNWITIDSSTNVVTVAPTQQEFLDYDTSTISVQIKSID